MAITLLQDVAHKEMPAGTDWIFTISSTNVVGNYKFKYFADLSIDLVGGAFAIRVKFSPNSTGNGIINLSNILEQYVSSDNLGSYQSGVQSSFKGIHAAQGSEMPIHCIDKLSLNTKNAQRLNIVWGEEYSVNSLDAPTEFPNQLYSSDYMFWNGVAYNNEQDLASGEYGINLSNWAGTNYIINNIQSEMLTDAPPGDNISTGQLIGEYDYATLSFINGFLSVGHSKPDSYKVEFFNDSGTLLSSNFVNINNANGGYNSTSDTSLQVSYYLQQYIGVGPANFLGAGITVPTTWSTYEVKLLTSGATVSRVYKYKRRDADCKGFEKIRLTWLNKNGVWDYYNFTKKNTRATNINRKEYNAIKGDWNSSTYTKYGYERGRGVLNTSATETISLNSDWFNNDTEAAWIEQLFISPEVYILNDYNVHDSAPANYGEYMTPVIVTNKSYDKYTRANDKLAQYEIDIEYAHNKRIQKA